MSTNIRVDLAIYPLDLVLRACHAFTARCYVTPRIVESGVVEVSFAPRADGDDGSLRELTGEFANALLDAQLRAIIADETRAVRELLVAQAFCEGDLLDRTDSESDEYADPRGIAR
jgi:His-Xaa-Ser system protein HxsD